jgi:hypothetical protein
MAAGTVRVKGLKELQRALGKVNKEAAKTVREEIKRAAKPVVSSAQQKLSAYQGASVGTIGPRASARGVFITQRARKVSGLRGDFGALQMRKVLEPALEEHQAEIVNEVEDALDRLGRSAGF